jgi:phage shock protein A
MQSPNCGDETGAKSALDQKLQAEKTAESLATEHDKQKVETEKLRRAVHDLEEKIRQARQKRTLLMARLTRADSSRRINAALDQAQSRSAFAQFGRLEARVERAEALSEATDRLEGRDPEAEELERKFETDERKERVQREFDDLKQRMGT